MISSTIKISQVLYMNVILQILSKRKIK